jgi:hypothetical protein
MIPKQSIAQHIRALHCLVNRRATVTNTTDLARLDMVINIYKRMYL